MASNIQELKMSAHTYTSQTAASSVVAALLPIMAAVSVAFLVTSLAMTVLPLHVHEGLGLGTFVVGLVAGAQFTTSLLSRFWSGSYADSHKGKRAGCGLFCCRRGATPALVYEELKERNRVPHVIVRRRSMNHLEES